MVFGADWDDVEEAEKTVRRPGHAFTMDELRTVVVMSDAPKHPAPWKWTSYLGQEGDLTDADGNFVVIGPGDYHEEVLLTDPLSAALISCAPEMEALLRAREWVGDTEQCVDCWGYANGPAGTTGHAPDCKLAALLARIDAAKAAG